MRIKQHKNLYKSINRRLARVSLMVVALGLMFMPLAAALPFGSLTGSSVVFAQDPGLNQPVHKLPPPPPITNNCPQGQCIADKYIQPVINVLAALVGVAVTISIIMAGIQYAASADNSQAVSAAKQRIVTSVGVLIGFLLFYAFLNWVIPGGLAPISK